MIFSFSIIVAAITLLALIISIPLLSYTKSVKKRDLTQSYPRKRYLLQILLAILVLSGASVVLLMRSGNVTQGDLPYPETFHRSPGDNTGEKNTRSKTTYDRKDGQANAAFLSDAHMFKRTPGAYPPGSNKGSISKRKNKPVSGNLLKDSLIIGDGILNTFNPGDTSKNTKDIKPGEKPSGGSSYNINKVKELAEKFLPSAIKTNLNEKSMQPDPAESRSQVFAKINKSNIGDFFVYGYYDEFKNGQFKKTDLLKIIVPDKTAYERTGINTLKENTIRIGIDIPEMDAGETLQLPFLLDGKVIAIDPNNTSFTLNEIGELRAEEKTPWTYLSYIIEKTNTPVEFITGFNDINALQKEFDNIPLAVKRILTSAIGKNDNEKLRAVSSALSKYFVYRSGLSDIVLEEKDTWNDLLGNNIQRNQAMACDCDILATYSYIYLRFLGLRPFLLIGFLKSRDNSNILTSSELHSSIYLKSENKWILFEPTLFAGNLYPKKDTTETSDAPIDRPAILAKKIIDQRLNNAVSGSSSSALGYFDDPAIALKDDYAVKKLKNLLDKNGFKALVEYDVDKLNKKYKAKEAYFKSKDLYKSTLIYSTYVYVFSAIIFFVLKLFKQKNRHFISDIHAGTFLAAMTIIVYYMLFSSLLDHAISFARSKFLHDLSPVFALLSSLLSILLVLSHIKIPQLNNRVLTAMISFIKKDTLFLSGIMLSIACALRYPAYPVLASVALLVKVYADQRNAG